MAQHGYQAVGRGAIFVDTTITMAHPDGIGHPSGYVDQQTVAQNADEDTQRMINEYDPTWEFVTTLFKSHDRVSSYRIGLIPTGNRSDGLDSRVEISQPGDPPPMKSIEPPDIETLWQWEMAGYCEATDGCVVEPDGVCSHGHLSWLLELGLI